MSRRLMILFPLLAFVLVICQHPMLPADDAKASDDRGDKAPRAKQVTLEGKAVMYGPAVAERLGISLLDPAMSSIVAFQTDDGRLLPILPTEAGLFFYKDERVRDRPMRVVGRWHEDASALEVIDRYVLVDGKPNEIYYWCEICSIRMYHLKECDCCQGPIELREHPVGESFRLKSE